jgi:hypothetical protein
MKLTLQRQSAGLVLIAINPDDRLVEFVGAVFQNARGDQPIKYTLSTGLGGRKICSYSSDVLEPRRKAHALAVAAQLDVELTEE